MKKKLDNRRAVGRRRYLVFIFFAFLMITLGAQNCSSDTKPGDGAGILTNTEAIAADKAALDEADFTFGTGDSSTSVTQDFTLPVSGSNGTVITWSSDNGAITISGGTATVTRPAFVDGNVTVTLTATITKGADSDTKVFTFTVKKMPPTDTEAVTANKAALAIIYGGSDSSDSVTRNVGLKTNGSDGAVISWVSDNPGVIAIDGTVTRPLFGSGNTAVTLTATIDKNGTSDTKVFNLTVIEGNTSYSAGSVSFNMAYVPGMSFPTGTDDSTTATVANDYLIGETEVTYELWYTVYDWAVNGTGSATGEGQYTFDSQGREGSDGTDGAVPTNQEPVTYINWRSAMVWMNALTEYYNAQEGVSLETVYYTDSGFITPIRDSSDGAYGSSVDLSAGSFDNPYVKSNANGFRLSSSDEWELAARYKGSDSANGAIEYPASSGNRWTPGNYASGATADYSDSAATESVAWLTTNSSGLTQPVSTKTANALGLYDMSGNVWEWNFDWHPLYVDSARVSRGGSWFDNAIGMQVGYVHTYYPYNIYNRVGFRLARTP